MFSTAVHNRRSDEIRLGSRGTRWASYININRTWVKHQICLPRQEKCFPDRCAFRRILEELKKWDSQKIREVPEIIEFRRNIAVWSPEFICSKWQVSRKLKVWEAARLIEANLCISDLLEVSFVFRSYHLATKWISFRSRQANSCNNNIIDKA